MKENKAMVLEFLRAGGRIRTRLRESGSGDTEFLQYGLWDLPKGVTSETELISSIRELESEGLIEASCDVHRFDPVEFLLVWRPK